MRTISVLILISYAVLFSVGRGHWFFTHMAGWADFYSFWVQFIMNCSLMANIILWITIPRIRDNRSIIG